MLTPICENHIFSVRKVQSCRFTYFFIQRQSSFLFFLARGLLLSQPLASRFQTHIRFLARRGHARIADIPPAGIKHIRKIFPAACASRFDFFPSFQLHPPPPRINMHPFLRAKLSLRNRRTQKSGRLSAPVEPVMKLLHRRLMPLILFFHDGDRPGKRHGTRRSRRQLCLHPFQLPNCLP